MKVMVKFRYSLREITGLREQKVEIPEGSTVMDLLEALVRLYGPPFREYIFDERTGGPSTYYQFTVDGKNLNSLNGFATQLAEGQTFDMLLPVVGG